jgi:hypothetical protein
MANPKAAASTNNGDTYSDEYYTPERYYKPLGNFDFDPCAGPSSCIATVNNRAMNGLEITWEGRVWLNPPYSKGAKEAFLDRLAAHGTGTALVPASTDTAWFAKAFQQASAVLLVTGRINFTRPLNKKSANAGGNAYFAFGSHDAEMLLKSGIKGIVIKQPEEPSRRYEDGYQFASNGV